MRSPSQHTAPTPRSASDFESQHYGGDAQSGSSLERMRSASGLATGRAAPRVPKRVNAASATLVDRGLASSGDVDPNQGRLLSHHQMSTYTKSDTDMAAQTGVPARRAAGSGWLTGVGQTPTRPYATVAAARAAGNTKAAAALSKRRTETIGIASDRLGSSTPTRSALQHRATRETNAPTDWYAGRAGKAISNEAQKSGLGANPNGFNIMRRATALSSPQKPWDSGHGQDDNYKQDNLNVAGGMVRHLNAEQASQGDKYDPDKSAASFRMPGVGHTEATPNLVQGQSPSMRRTIARHYETPTHEEPALASDAQKVRNFDVALAADHTSVWARRQAAQAYTSDTHDSRAMGDKGGTYNTWVGRPSSGGYEFAAMTGRRAAMRQSSWARKTGNTPRTSSEYQENTWEAQRQRTNPSIPKQRMDYDEHGQTIKGRQALIQRGPRKSEVVSPLALPHQDSSGKLSSKQFSGRYDEHVASHRSKDWRPSHLDNDEPF